VRQFREITDSIPQSEKAFAIAKDAVTKQMASQRTTKFGVISAYLSAERKGYDFDPNKKIYEDVQKVTLADIVAFEKAQMAGKTGRYIILGDEKELDMKSLEQVAPIRRVTLDEVFGY
jgi:predicted Zn-dependent peptidase